jgi:ABC-2 type transport system permease protein
MSSLLHLLRLWFIQIRYAATRELAFRANFFVWVIVELAWFVLQLAFVGVVYQHVDSIAGWSRPQMIVLVATNQLIQQIFTAFFMPGLVKLPELVRDGKLDFVLLKPTPPQFLISTSHLEIGPLANAVIAAVVVASALHDLHITPSLPSIILYLLLLLAGLLTHYALLLTLVSLTFWIIQAESVLLGYYSIFQVARLPREAAKGWFRILFTFALPLLLVANIPATTLLRGSQLASLLLFLLTSLTATLFASLFFQLGLRRYQSASS